MPTSPISSIGFRLQGDQRVIYLLETAIDTKFQQHNDVLKAFLSEHPNRHVTVFTDGDDGSMYNGTTSVVRLNECTSSSHEQVLSCLEEPVRDLRTLGNTVERLFVSLTFYLGNLPEWHQQVHYPLSPHAKHQFDAQSRRIARDYNTLNAFRGSLKAWKDSDYTKLLHAKANRKLYEEYKILRDRFESDIRSPFRRAFATCGDLFLVHQHLRGVQGIVLIHCATERLARLKHMLIQASTTTYDRESPS